MGVVAGGDGVHGVGEGLDGLGDLLREMEREPGAGEEREAGHHQKKDGVEIADLAAGAEEGPVGVGGGVEAGHGGGHAEGDGEADDDGAALFESGGAEGVVGGADGEEGLIVALRGGEDGGVDGLAGGVLWSGARCRGCGRCVIGDGRRRRQGSRS